ncbi:N-acetylmuramoyl-L-alanine amidase [Clostridium sp. 1001271B_151109_B4]|uniref:N-acetylmuramoyl-L-alanine amidase n=1 Tax=Clostridium sp. 1001271B_151109_B4 TaxID=2787148 RepID=UPI0018A8D11E|nr:N-acetylmuramoyl-L-alanine amidase [Clostridium sp. 1001271B_151109_B4]
MKIAVRGGHCPKVPGARGILDELTEDRKVKDAVIKYLKQLGNEVLDVTPPDSTSSSSSDLSYGVNKANNWGADLFVSIHFNKAYDSYNGALGSEVCVYSTHDIAQRVVNGLGELGFKNRGQKIRTGLYELKHTNMKSMIVETCFVEATEDVALYRKLGSDTIGKAIAEAIVNKKIDVEIKENNKEDNEEMNYSMYVFSQNWYLKKYADVSNSTTYKNNPYKHYVDYGKKEGRLALPPIPAEYNEGSYLELNPDVAAAVKKGSYSSGIDHYLQYGFCENRKIYNDDSLEAIKKRCEELEIKLEDIKKIVD